MESAAAGLFHARFPPPLFYLEASVFYRRVSFSMRATIVKCAYRVAPAMRLPAWDVYRDGGATMERVARFYDVALAREYVALMNGQKTRLKTHS